VFLAWWGVWPNQRTLQPPRSSPAGLTCQVAPGPGLPPSPQAWRGAGSTSWASSGSAGIAHRWPAIGPASRRSAAERGPLGWFNRTGSRFGGGSRRAVAEPGSVPPLEKPRQWRSQRSLFGSPLCWPAHVDKGTARGRGPDQGSQTVACSARAPEAVRQPCVSSPPSTCPSPSNQ